MYDVDADGFAIDDDGEWILDEDENYLNAEGEAVDGDTGELLEDDSEEESDEDDDSEEYEEESDDDESEDDEW